MTYHICDYKFDIITIEPFDHGQHMTSTPWGHILDRVSNTKKHIVDIEVKWMSLCDYERILNTIKTNECITFLKLLHSSYFVQRNLQLVSDIIRDGYITSISLIDVSLQDDNIPIIIEIINLNKLKHLYIVQARFSKKGFDLLVEAVRNSFVLLNCVTEPCFEHNLDDIFIRNQKLTKQSIHTDLLNFVMTFSSLNLPQYVLLWIFDWTTPYIHLFHHHFKISLIVSILSSIDSVKNKQS